MIATSSVICVTAADSFPTVFANMLLPQVQLILCPLNQFLNYNEQTKYKDEECNLKNYLDRDRNISLIHKVVLLF